MFNILGLDAEVSFNMMFNIPRNLISRNKELLLLAGYFIKDKYKIGLITGPVAVGKTVLANIFMHEFHSSFPGGILYTDGTMLSDNDKLEQLYKSIINTKEPRLLVIDECSVLDNENAINIFRNLSTINNNIHILGISQRDIESKLINFRIALGNFSREETFDLLKRSLGSELDENSIKDINNILSGSPLSINELIKYINKIYWNPKELIDALKPIMKYGILGLDGNPLNHNTSQYKSIITDIKSINGDLINKINKDPKILYQISPRAFEQLVAELLSKQGYKIELTPYSKDGGKDIYAAKKTDLGLFLFLIECKRYSPHNHVGVEIIQRLYGNVMAENATAGILVTTSFFTKGAKEFQKNIEFRISLRDYLDIQKWISGHNLNNDTV
jgi:restriction system protein